MVIPCSNSEDDIGIQGNINNKETNESINNSNTGRVKTKAWPKRTCLVTGDSMLGHTLCWHILMKLECPENLKVRPGAKTEGMFHYLVPLLEKVPDYVILYVGTNDAINYEASDIVKKILMIKEFIKFWVPNCKVISSRLIKGHDNDNASIMHGRSNCTIAKTNYWYDRKWKYWK